MECYIVCYILCIGWYFVGVMCCVFFCDYRCEFNYYLFSVKFSELGLCKLKCIWWGGLSCVRGMVIFDGGDCVISSINVGVVLDVLL